MLKRCGSFTVVICLLLASLLTHAETETLGTTYPIQEVDAMEEIMARAQKIQGNPLATPSSQWGALQPYPLPVAATDMIRAHVPWYTVPEAIKDAKGRVIYPKGYQFNPLLYVRMPNRLVVASEQTLPLVSKQLRATDQLILCHGDLLKTGERLERPVFLLTQQLKERLGLTCQPAIVEQVDEKLLITEIAGEIPNG